MKHKWKFYGDYEIHSVVEGSFDFLTCEKEYLGCFTAKPGKNYDCIMEIESGNNPLNSSFEEKGLGDWDFGKNAILVDDLIDVPSGFQPTERNFLEEKLRELIPLGTTYEEWIVSIKEQWKKILSIKETLFNMIPMDDGGDAIYLKTSHSMGGEIVNFVTEINNVGYDDMVYLTVYTYKDE